MRDHHQAIEPERDACAVRQAVPERREQPLIERILRLAPRSAHGQVALEAAALLARVAELAESVGELEAVHVQLEALRDLRAIAVSA
jgi:hypothetical protein